MSGLRVVATTPLQEFDLHNDQDLRPVSVDTLRPVSGDSYRPVSVDTDTANNNDSLLSVPKVVPNPSSDPSMLPNFDPVLQSVEREFGIAQEKMFAHQKKTLRLLQEFCTKTIQQPIVGPQPILGNAISSVNGAQPILGNALSTDRLSKASQAWSDHRTSALSNQRAPLAQKREVRFLQRPCTPLGFAPEMPDALTPADTWLKRPEARMATTRPPRFGRPSIEDVGGDLTASFTTEKSVIVGNKRKERRRVTQSAQGDAAEEIQQEKKAGSDPTKNPAAPKAVFADAAAMKDKIKENVMKPTYNVANFYKTHGFAQYIARTAIFDNLTLFVIALNALWIWIDTDYNDAATLLEADRFFQIVENLFCIYFFSELMIRYLAFEHKKNCLRDAWFVFDSCLVLMMVCETWLLNLAVFAFGIQSQEGLGNASILRLVRLLRLTRMARMARLLRAMPELMVLVKGISVAARSVIFTLLLLVVILYVFAIAFRQITEGSELEESHFTTVPMSMGTLLLQGILPDEATLVNEVCDVSYIYGAFVVVFLLLASLTIMNMLVGVLCEVVSVVSSVEKEQMMVNFVKTKLLALINESGIDKDDNKRISREEFEQLLLLPEGARIIQEVGVDVVGLVDFVPTIFDKDTELTFADVMELVLQLRGSNTATVRDIVDLRKFLTQMSTEVHDQVMQKMEETLAVQSTALSCIQSTL